MFRVVGDSCFGLCCIEAFPDVSKDVPVVVVGVDDQGNLEGKEDEAKVISSLGESFLAPQKPEKATKKTTPPTAMRTTLRKLRVVASSRMLFSLGRSLRPSCVLVALSSSPTTRTMEASSMVSQRPAATRPRPRTRRRLVKTKRSARRHIAESHFPIQAH